MNLKRLLITSFLFFSLNLLAKGYDIVVSLDGTGDFSSVQEAINSIRTFRPEGRTVIFIKKGVYKEKVVLPSNRTQITLLGEDRDSTIITWDDQANKNNMGTFKTYTFFVNGNDIIFKNLTIENNAPQIGQAVSLHAEGDRIIFVNCKFLGNQDTIYLGREDTRMYFKDCYIEGTTDFIFGHSTAWFEGCEIHCKRNSFITAASTPENIKYGFIFNKCNITAAPEITKVYLGRPWRAYAMVIFKECNLCKAIRPEGWHNWRSKEKEKTARYFEYKNTGPGSDLSKRVKWSNVLTKKQAKKITLKSVFGNWNPLKEL